ncbi:UNVERIFIED_CONTAM: hypothetical protein HHA_454620 [Hammondia hammondi]|eukprot:XP_008888201.1 hypothetical protein HHA_454620 [Hammondia hammondi]
MLMRIGSMPQEGQPYREAVPVEGGRESRSSSVVEFDRTEPFEDIKKTNIFMIWCKVKFFLGHPPV